jgi:hypothetical protein
MAAAACSNSLVHNMNVGDTDSNVTFINATNYSHLPKHSTYILLGSIFDADVLKPLISGTLQIDDNTDNGKKYPDFLKCNDVILGRRYKYIEVLVSKSTGEIYHANGEAMFLPFGKCPECYQEYGVTLKIAQDTGITITKSVSSSEYKF